MSNPLQNEQLSVKTLLEIDSICDRFEGTLKSGRGEPIDEHLRGLTGARRQLALCELLLLEIGYRMRAGERPNLEEYLRRFPDDRDVVALVLADAGGAEPSLPRASAGADAPTTAYQASPAMREAGAKAASGSAIRKSRPASLGQVTRWLTESELMTAAEIEDFIAALPPEKCNGKQAIEEMYRQGRLTKFQAQAVFQGRVRGLVVGSYIVLDRLGQGGMGYVYKARHRTMKRTVALKVLPSAAMNSPGAVKRFHREIEAVARLRHANIVSALDADEDRGIHFLVMECIEGRDLRTYVRSQGPLPPRFAAECILQAARGLAYAHEQGVIHRDIKPGNLMLDARGTILVLDLGLAKIEYDSGEADRNREALTHDGQLMGTPDFMSPEQAFDCRDADAQSDIYSLGCTLYFLIAGKPPFPGDTQLKKVLAHRGDTVPSLAVASAGVPQPLEVLFQRMMTKNPEHRPQRMLEVVAALEACLGNWERSGEVVDTFQFAARESEIENVSAEEGSFLEASLFLPSKFLSSVVEKSKVGLGRHRWLSITGLALAAITFGGLGWAMSRGGRPEAEVKLDPTPPPVVTPASEDVGPGLWRDALQPYLQKNSSTLAAIWKQRLLARESVTRWIRETASPQSDLVELVNRLAPSGSGGVDDVSKPKTDSMQGNVDAGNAINAARSPRDVPEAEVKPQFDIVAKSAVNAATPVVEPVVAKSDRTPRQYRRSVADNFEVQDLTLAHSKYRAGQTIVFNYNLANVANRDASIPAELGKGGIDQNTLAARQHWIELLGDHPTIPALEGRFHKVDQRYHITEILLLNKGSTPFRIKRGGKLPCTGEVQTVGFPPGHYRYAVELQAMRLHAVVSKQELEFEIVSAAKP